MSDVKIKPVKAAAKLLKTVKYSRDKDEFMNVTGVQIGKALHLIFVDKNNRVEFWSAKNIIEMHISNHDTTAAHVGMDYLTRNKLINKKTQKEIEGAIISRKEEIKAETVTGLRNTINLLAEHKDNPEVQAVLADVKDTIDEVLKIKE